MKSFTCLCGLGQTTAELKSAPMIAIHKKGRRKQVENCRPVGFTCILCKFLEKPVDQYVSEYFMKYPLLCKRQHRFEGDISFPEPPGTLYKRWFAGVYHLDISRARGSVKHRLMMHIISPFEVSVGLKLGFSTSRFFYVRTGNKGSEWLEETSWLQMSRLMESEMCYQTKVIFACQSTSRKNWIYRAKLVTVYWGQSCWVTSWDSYACRLEVDSTAPGCRQKARREVSGPLPVVSCGKRVIFMPL